MGLMDVSGAVRSRRMRAVKVYQSAYASCFERRVVSASAGNYWPLAQPSYARYGYESPVVCFDRESRAEDTLPIL